MAEIGLIKRVKYAGDVHAELLKAGWDLDTATAFVNNIPDADIAPVRHGRWVPKRKVYRTPSAKNHTCSECGLEVAELWHYCPNCGAQMDGERKERA